MPARRPISTSSSRSVSLNTRPDSALTNEMTPVGGPEAATIGAVTAERMPRLRISSSCSASSTAASSISSGISGISWAWPSRRTCADPASSLVCVG